MSNEIEKINFLSYCLTQPNIHKSGVRAASCIFDLQPQNIGVIFKALFIIFKNPYKICRFKVPD